MGISVSRLIQALKDFELGSTGKWFILSAMVGLVAGAGAIAFYWLGQIVHHITLTQFAGYTPSEPIGEFVIFPHGQQTLLPWMIVAVMGLGGLVSGWLVYTFAPEAEGHGTDAAIDSFHNKRGEIRFRIPVIKTLASAITLGTGGSAGREGPIAQIGAGFGSLLATKLNLTPRDRRILLAAGMGAGVGAIFRAPLAGALFAGEILYRDADLEADVIVPSAVSSTVAYSVFCLSLPASLRFSPLFGEHVQFEVATIMELLPYTCLAIVLALFSVLYIKTFSGMQKLFRNIPVVPHLRPMIGAVVAGLVGVSLYFAWGQNADTLAVLGSGYGLIQKAFGDSLSLSITLLVFVAFFKIVTTSLTISSGGSGGVFGPSMVIGACLGASVGQGFHAWWPEVVRQPQAFAIVGMAGFFAGCARAPFSTILMVTEMTGDYKLLLPAMWVSTLCFLLCSRWTLYDKQVRSRLDSPAHRGDFILDVLEGIRVRDVYEDDQPITTFHEGATLDEIVHRVAETSQRYFPVLDADQQMIGIFSIKDVRSYLYNDAIWTIANARDVMTHRVATVFPSDDLNTALTKFTALNIEEIPVVAPDNPKKVIGILRHKQAITAYNQRRLEHRRDQDLETTKLG